jgi:hypothetical protein
MSNYQFCQKDSAPVLSALHEAAATECGYNRRKRIIQYLNILIQSLTHKIICLILKDWLHVSAVISHHQTKFTFT